jgi:hypothetical protein
MTKPLPQLRFQKRCWCGQPAVAVKTIRKYRAQGRLEPLWAAHFVPRADMRPPEPLCVHHMVRFLTRLYGPAVRKIFWGDRFSQRRRNMTAWRHSRPCQARRTNGSPCCARAKRGRLYCHAHESRPRQLWSLRPRQMGHQCKATSVSTRMRCQNRAVRPYGVCWQHGAKAALSRRAIAARPHNAAEAAARKAKQRKHRDYARLRAAGKAPPPLKESPSRYAQRRTREDRAEHRVAVLQGRAMPDGERLFREHHERRERPRRLPPLYEC